MSHTRRSADRHDAYYLERHEYDWCGAEDKNLACQMTQLILV